MKTALDELYDVVADLFPLEYANELENHFTTAKEKEKQQIVEAYGKQFIMHLDGQYDWFTGDQYYENKFGNNILKTIKKENDESTSI